MLERTDNIARDQCDWPAEKEGRKGHLGQALIDKAGDITLVEHHARWRRVKVRNSPGRRMGGLVGTFLYEGWIVPYAELLETVVHLGIGKGTTWGFGHVSYRIVDREEW